MIDLENRIERDELIDDYFNKGYACNIREVYQAIVNTVADLEYANDEKSDEIERLTELCNKYEEEHNTTFETWQKDIKENELLHSIIKEVREYCLEKAKGKLERTLYDDILEILDKKENI